MPNKYFEQQFKRKKNKEEESVLIKKYIPLSKLEYTLFNKIASWLGIFELGLDL
jgi:hypothetical protein